MQLGLVKTQFGTSEYPRVLPEPDPRMEVPQPDAGGQTNGALVPGTLLGPESRWGGHSHRGRGRDSQVLERLQQGPISERNEIRSQSIRRH